MNIQIYAGSLFTQTPQAWAPTASTPASDWSASGTSMSATISGFQVRLALHTGLSLWTP